MNLGKQADQSINRVLTGVDIAEVDRVENLLKRYGQRFLNKVYTAAEQKFAHANPERLASRFAAKEAVIKALNPHPQKIDLRSVEVLRRNNDAPTVKLHGTAQRMAHERGMVDLSVSLSHSKHLAIAVVVALCHTLG